MIKDLSKSQNEIIVSFYKDNKPLFIYGESGCGKSSIGKEILKKYQVNELNSLQIKKYKDIKDYILDTISKKNITLMFSEKKERGLIIDDFDVFQKLDKKSYKEIIIFLKAKKYFSCKIVVIFHSSLLKKKELYKLDAYKIYLNYTPDKIENIIGKRNNNGNEMNLNILLLNKKTKIENDIFKGQIEIVQDILENKGTVKDILNMNLGDENIFLLNLLENIYNIVSRKDITKIYERYINYDYMELFSTKNHIWEIKEYSKEILLRNIYIRSIYKKKSCKKMIDQYKYNSYISKSILSVTSKKTEYESYISLFVYLFMVHKKKKDEYNRYIDNIPSEKKKKIVKIYNYFYEESLGPHNL